MSETQQFLYLAFTAGFGVATLGYLVVLVLSIGGRAGAKSQLGALGLATLTAVLNTAFLVVRGIETGQMPIQSKFETWVIVLFGISAGFVVIVLANKLWRKTGVGAIFGAGFGLFTMLMGLAGAYRGYVSEDWVALFRPPALKSIWFAPHVLSYLFAYGALVVAFAGGVACIVATWITGRTNAGDIDWDGFLHRTMTIGFPALTIGLLLGSVWGQEAWSTYWGWDIKETWALITWLVFLIYFHVRYEREFQGTAGAWVIVIGCAAVMLTYLGMSLLPDSVSSLHVYN
jgi:cytochrome c-type biogenesis protein CcsB